MIPIDLCNGPTTFQRLMNMPLSDFMHCMIIYTDDKVVFSPSVEQNLLDLLAVFEKLHSDKLQSVRNVSLVRHW